MGQVGGSDCFFWRDGGGCGSGSKGRQCTEQANKIILQYTDKEQDQVANDILILQPLGLSLPVTPSLIESMERQLNGYPNTDPRSVAKVDNSGSQFSNEKLKASNFPASRLKIGSWEVTAKNEGELVAKCYFGKRKLVWEVLDKGLKNKIEIQWIDIVGINAVIVDNQPAILHIELNNPPTFHEETDPQPRKHTIWRIAPDFTGGQASIYRRHYVEFPPGSLDKHYEKLLQCDSRLRDLSQARFPTSESLYFEPDPRRIFDSPFSYNPYRPVTSFRFPPVNPNYASIPSPGMHIKHAQALQHPSRGTPSPISVMDFSPSDENQRMAFYGQLIDSYSDSKAGGPGLASGGAVQSVQPTPDITSQNLRDCSQAVAEKTNDDILHDLECQLLNDEQVGDYDESYHLARVQSLTELVDLSKQGSSANDSDHPEVNMILTDNEHGIGVGPQLPQQQPVSYLSSLPRGTGVDESLVLGASEYPGGQFYQQQPTSGIPPLVPSQDTPEIETTNQPWKFSSDYSATIPDLLMEDFTF